ncbi:MAG: polysaccharide biosynthesis protein [Rhizorhabdus sp.]|uniref:polysaccharide biosynthesis protein n=1 Tax=Rhizorhabdus sp. TaxID=1968843 RepID=UPI001B712B06|nr:polysaccharide biosynthesis protein [Rhizorhabdus sp.]MBP8231746.1 polysaccharide biosynthesis protein [Rhizorhabdus sp.]
MTSTPRFYHESVCVTGAGGSIGSEICRQLLAERVRKLVLVSLTEAGLYNIERELRPIANAQDCELVPILGSVLNPEVSRRSVQDTGVVIHAAAHKHVPICERNLLEAVANNVFGTYVLLREAARAGVEQFIQISTDKAVRPASVMGATKRLCEKLMQSPALVAPHAITAAVVRFGNVMDSAGSVFPLWREQLARGGPITLTDKRCERYFMTIPEAVMLVMKTAAFREAGTFVLDMGKPKNMYDLALELSQGKVEIVETGLRPGEKLTEELDYGGAIVATGDARIRRIIEPASGAITASHMQCMYENYQAHCDDRVGFWLQELTK